MSEIIEMLDKMLGHIRLEVATAVNSNDKKKAIKILRQINKMLPKENQNELLS